MSPGFTTSGAYALEIGGSEVSALRLGGSRGRLKLREYFTSELPEGLVVDGEITDVDLLARELKLFVKQHGLRGRAVQLGVSNQKVIVRNIDLPEMTAEELRGALEYQAQDYIPIPIEEAVVDFQVLGSRESADGGKRQEVLLVAAQKQMITNFLDCLKQAGLRVLGIDIYGLALVRALLPEAYTALGGDESRSCRGIADVSTSVCTLAVAEGSVLRFSRVINFSSDRFARVLSEQRGLPLSDATLLVENVGLEGPLSPVADVYSPEVVTETRQLLSQLAAELSGEIRRSFDYYQSQEHGTPVVELLLSGRGALIPNLDAHLHRALGIPVQIANPLHLVAQNSSKVSDAELGRLAPKLSVLVGLALPEAD